MQSNREKAQVKEKLASSSAMRSKTALSIREEVPPLTENSSSSNLLLEAGTLDTKKSLSLNRPDFPRPSPKIAASAAACLSFEDKLSGADSVSSNFFFFVAYRNVR